MKFSSAMMLALAVAVLACAVSPSDAKVILVNMPNPAPAGYRVMAVWEAEFRQAELRALMSQWSICALSGGSASGWGYATAKAPAALQSPDERSSGCVFMTNDTKTAVITTLENTVSGRYAFDVNGKSVHPYAREQEGGWTKAPQAMLMSNATNTKAIWVIIPVPGIAGGYFIQNMATSRYMFDTGNTKNVTKRGSEGGWLSAPAAVTADANYYNLAVWRFESVKGMDGVFFIVNAITKRLLFNSNLPANKWPIVANIVTADDNYYGNAEWRIPGLKL